MSLCRRIILPLFVTASLSHPSLASASFDPPVRCSERPTGLHEVMKDPPSLCRIPLGQEIVDRPTQSDVDVPDSPEVHAEVVRLPEGPLGEQELPPGGAQGFAGRPFPLLVFGQALVGFPRQDLDTGQDLIDPPAKNRKGLLMPGDLLLQIGCSHNLTVLREPISSVP